ncbi:hypothetical protein RFI_07496 [Reticulomyxa filosa]|uniref:RGS domain-containing protein n=1 Tax=Reticulomyxa filosa TaxID=46433 RepID=X6NUZ8_RETFI|nr:hypothetical protein RFI_07496 [Reticulomyxa filosa]|eukprot:ETO29624.1 hypothetical protein RFI_07496 [Reticulomyxa filosa]
MDYFVYRIHLPRKLRLGYLVEQLYKSEITIDQAITALYKKYIQRGNSSLEINIPYDISLRCQFILFEQKLPQHPSDNYTNDNNNNNADITPENTNIEVLSLSNTVTVEMKLRCLDAAVRELSNLLRDSFIRFERTDVCDLLWHDYSKTLNNLNEK